MAIIKRATSKSIESTKIFKAVAVAAAAVMMILALLANQKSSFIYSSNVDYHVDEKCTNLPSIRSSGSYFLDDKIAAGLSSKDIIPSFKVGSFYAEKVPYHMSEDGVYMHLIKDLLKGKEGGLVLDIGANQGFFTYFLASVGMEVHSFEIEQKNFRALQHGAEFNTKKVADLVHLYPVGLGEKNSRFSMKGSNYEGFLTEGKSGPILGVSFDCFAHHMRGKLDTSNVAFIKLDVEGFEIAVLKGGQNSLFKLGQSNIGGMLMEVGPDRWGRASVDFATGCDEMKKLSRHFKDSYVLMRTKGGYAKTCPLSLAENNLSDKKPITLDGAVMYAIKMGEFEPLLKDMVKNHYDCNFFYKND